MSGIYHVYTRISELNMLSQKEMDACRTKKSRIYSYVYMLLDIFTSCSTWLIWGISGGCVHMYLTYHGRSCYWEYQRLFFLLSLGNLGIANVRLPDLSVQIGPECITNQSFWMKFKILYIDLNDNTYRKKHYVHVLLWRK